MTLLLEGPSGRPARRGATILWRAFDGAAPPAITVESVEGKGTTLRVALPLAASGASQPLEEAA